MEASRSQALAVAVVTPSSGNGVYASGATTKFPNATYQSRNYWVDVAFTTNPPPTTGLTIWSATDVPAATAAAGSSVNLGVKFKSDIDGFITGIRFYKGAINTGTHVGALWSSTGVQLASATFTDESASGWQQVSFASPVPITANTVYVASYLAPKGGYSLNDAYFATVGTDTPPLHALKSSGNGGNVGNRDATLLRSMTVTPSLVLGVVDCVEGASVQLIKDGQTIARATTDNYGDFKFDKLDENSGRYTIEVMGLGRTKMLDASLGASVFLGEIRL